MGQSADLDDDDLRQLLADKATALETLEVAQLQCHNVQNFARPCRVLRIFCSFHVRRNPRSCWRPRGATRRCGGCEICAEIGRRTSSSSWPRAMAVPVARAATPRRCWRKRGAVARRTWMGAASPTSGEKPGKARRSNSPGHSIASVLAGHWPSIN